MRVVKFNLGLAIGMVMKFYNSVVNGLKLKVRKFWGLIPTFVEVTVEKLVGGGGGTFCGRILNRVKGSNYNSKTTNSNFS